MYQIFDIVLDSDMPIPELPEAVNAVGTLKIKKGIKQSDWFNKLSWQHHWYAQDESVCISLAKCDDGYVLRFPDLVDFIITFSNLKVEYYADIKTPPETIRHLLLDQVIPRILGQQGRLILHASAIVLPVSGKAIAFIGDSGWGKSTIASSFHKNGARLLTDDCLLIEIYNGKVYCIPNYYGLRLLDDSTSAIFDGRKKSVKVAHYSEKKRLLIDSQKLISEPTELSGIFLLENPANLSKLTKILIEPITEAQELMKLIGQIFVIDVTEKSLYKKLFNNIREMLSQKVPIYGLSYPHDYSLLPAVLKKISNTCSETPVNSVSKPDSEKKTF